MENRLLTYQVEETQSGVDGRVIPVRKDTDRYQGREMFCFNTPSMLTVV